MEAYTTPLNVGEILDASVRLYRKTFFPLILAQLPLALFYLGYNTGLYVVRIHTTSIFGLLGQPFLDSLIYLLFLYDPAFDPATYFFLQRNPYFVWISIGLSVIYIAVVYPVTCVAVTKVASDNVVKRPSSVKNAYTFSVKMLWKSGVLNSVITVALAAIGIVSFTIVAVLLFSLGFDLVTTVDAVVFFVAFLAGLFPLFYVWARIAAVYPVMVNEGVFGTALKRSSILVRGYTVKVFSVTMLVVLVSFGVVLSSDAVGHFLDWYSHVLLLVFGAVSQGVIIPLLHCTRVVIYFSLKTTKEGFDLEKRAEKLDNT